MISPEIIARVLHLKYGNTTATGFTVEKDNVQYVVTVKHLLNSKTPPKTLTIQIKQKGSFRDFEVNAYYHKNPDIDLVILKPKSNSYITSKYNLSLRISGIVLSQDAYFMGYPYHMEMYIPGSRYTEHCPLIKKACLSGIINEKNIQYIVLDCHNNLGFSGGPVCVKIPGMSYYSICGVMRSYVCNESSVLSSSGKDTGYFIKENSGIAFATSVKHVREILDSI